MDATLTFEPEDQFLGHKDSFFLNSLNCNKTVRFPAEETYTII